VNAFFAGLGGKLAERWLSLLLVPGVVYCVVAVSAARLGHGHAFDVARLVGWVDEATSPGSRPVASGVVVVIAVVAGSAAAGLAAAGLGWLAEQVMMAPVSRPPVGWLTRSRGNRWRRAEGKVGDALGPAVRGAGGSAPDAGTAIAERDRIGLVEPRHPTWTGDRLSAVDVRIAATYGLDLRSAWPRLWLIMPEEARTELSAAQDAMTRALRLLGWAGLYALLTLWWWPAVMVGLAIAALARYRIRAAVSVLADLSEAAVDVYATALADRLGVSHPGWLTREVGQDITSRLRKDRLPGGTA
jgi:hypothetical protein